MLQFTDKGNRLKNLSLLLATPFYKREAYTNYIASLLPCIKALDMIGIPYQWIQVAGDAYVDRAKNSLLAYFLTHPDKLTDLIMIDSDLGWDLNGFLRLLMSPEEFTCGVPPMKHDGTYAIRHVPEGPVMNDDGLIEVVWATGGFVHFKRSCIEKMSKHYESDYYEDARSAYKGRTVNLYSCAVYEGLRYGEDVEFCRKWNMLGGKVFVEPKIEFEHVGSNVTTGTYWDSPEMTKVRVLDSTLAKDGLIDRT